MNAHVPTACEILAAVAARYGPLAPIPAQLGEDAVREAAGLAHRPRPGCPWSTEQIGTEFGIHPKTVSEKIGAGEFDVPDGPRPWKDGKGQRSPWVVPDACVQRYRERRNGRVRQPVIATMQVMPGDVPIHTAPAPRRAAKGSHLQAIADARQNLRVS